MKSLLFVIISWLSICLSCYSNNKQGKTETATEAVRFRSVSTDKTQDKEEIQKLIRTVLNWSQSDSTFHLLPCLTNKNGSIYVGFDMKQLHKNVEILHKTDLFSNEFIDNYKRIILTLDKKIRNKQFEVWFVGDLPTFSFANDVDPWSLSQDVPYDKPNPLDYVEVTTIKLDNTNGDLYWTWGKPELNDSPDWKTFSYKFKVTQKKGRWRISYLQGFDFNDAIR